MKDVKCPYCDKIFETEDSNLNKEMPCPFCEKIFKAKEEIRPEEKYRKAVNNLGLAIGLSIVNLVLVLSDSAWVFAFSLWITEMLAEWGPIGITLSILLLIVYAVMFFACKERTGVFVAAFIMVCIDTVLGLILNVLAFLGGETENLIVSLIIGIVFHGWLLWEMGKGLAAGKNMKNNIVM